MAIRTLQRHGLDLVLMDSISFIAAEHADKVVICGSHGGLDSGRHAIRYPPKLVVFNDAGVGKDRAGVAALTQLESFRIPALAVAATSARIGDAEDTLANGVVSHSNALAVAAGLQTGERLDALLRRLAAGNRSQGDRLES